MRAKRRLPARGPDMLEFSRERPEPSERRGSNLAAGGESNRLLKKPVLDFFNLASKKRGFCGARGRVRRRRARGAELCTLDCCTPTLAAAAAVEVASRPEPGRHR